MQSRKYFLRAFFFVFLLTCLLTALVGTVRIQPVRAISSNIVISQVYGGGGNTGATYTNDFIELHNIGSSTVSLNGWSVQYAGAGANTWSNADKTNLSGSIAPGQYFLIQEAQGAGGTTALPTPDVPGTVLMSATAGKVALVNTTTLLTGNGCPFDASVIDFVGYGTTANCSETAAAPAPSNTNANIRSASGCTDTDNNSSDFTTGAPNPRNTNSTGLICGVGTYTPTNTATNTATATATPIPPIEVVINEVAWAGTSASSDDQWIELYNPGATVDIGGWRLVSASGGLDITFPLGTSINAGSYFLIERRELATNVPANLITSYPWALNPNGDILRLRKPNGAIVDTANSNGGAWPSVSGPPNFPSMERVGAIPDSDFAWATYNGTPNPTITDANGNMIYGTPGYVNSQIGVTPTFTLTPSLTPSLTLTPTFTPSPTLTRTITPTRTPTGLTLATNIVISEFRTIGSSGGNDEFIELYNPTNLTISIGGWTIRRSTGKTNGICGTTTALVTTIPATVSLVAGQHYLIKGTNYSSTVSADLSTDIGVANDGGIALLNSNGVIVDQVGLCSTTTYHEGTALTPLTTNTNRSYDRKASTSGICADTNNNVVDFFLRNTSDPQNSSTIGRCGNPTPTPTKGPEPTKIKTSTPIPPPPPQLLGINEFVPRPGHDWNNDGQINTGDEYIELINFGVVNVSLSGYRLDDEANVGSTPFGLPAVTLKPGERRVFYESQTNIHLDDGGDGVRLIKPNGQLADAYNYSVVKYPDQSYCRLPDNGGLDDWNQNCAPTPGLRNAPRNGSENLPIVNGDDNSCPVGDTLPLDFWMAECEPFGNNIWSRLYWDAKGWLGEKILPNTNGQWDVYGD